MSALGGAVGVAAALIVEEVLVTSSGGPSAIAGIGGTAVTIIDHLADPARPAIPDLRKKAAPGPKPGGKGSTQFTPGTKPSTLVPLGNGRSVPASQLPGGPGSIVSP